MRRVMVVVAAMAVVAGTCLTSAAPVSAQEPEPITGAGSTFAQIAIDQWRADANRRLGIQVDYQGTGSTAGRNSFATGTVDFASSDVAYQEGEPVPPAGSYTYIPLVAGGTALMYNLRDLAGRRINTLKLSGRVATLIFTGVIRSWRDPQILADNPDLVNRLPDRSIQPVVRTGGAGSTANFTSYLANAAPAEWRAFVDEIRSSGNPNWVITDPAGGFTVRFPPNFKGNLPVNGSDGIANFVASFPNGEGSIGYAEAGFAIQKNLPVASIRNAAGAWTQPTARAVAIALTRATRNPDGTQNLAAVYGNPDPEAYPISSYSYLIAPTGGSATKGETLRRFVIYSVTEGQRKAQGLGYSPLPKSLIQQAFDAIRSVPGTTQPPPIDSVPEYYEELVPPTTSTTTTLPTGAAGPVTERLLSGTASVGAPLPAAVDTSGFRKVAVAAEAPPGCTVLRLELVAEFEAGGRTVQAPYAGPDASVGGPAVAVSEGPALRSTVLVETAAGCQVRWTMWGQR